MERMLMKRTITVADNNENLVTIKCLELVEACVPNDYKVLWNKKEESK